MSYPWGITRIWAIIKDMKKYHGGDPKTSPFTSLVCLVYVHWGRLGKRFSLSQTELEGNYNYILLCIWCLLEQTKICPTINHLAKNLANTLSLYQSVKTIRNISLLAGMNPFTIKPQGNSPTPWQIGGLIIWASCRTPCW